MIGIGIDTGGTCTDAVVYDTEKKQVLAAGKSQTTHDNLEIGIGASVGKLPKTYLAQAEYISLSTTLATNACVEGKGGRALLIFVGVEQKTVADNYEKYGFENLDQMLFLDGDAKKNTEPDWNAFEERVKNQFGEWDSVAVAQIYPKENNGAYEKKVKEIVDKYRDIPVICAYELFSDINVLQRGSSALLNARLIPVIRDFLIAVKKVLADQDIHLPLVIMRSDGSLMSEKFALYHPVETLLCGPAASVKGGAAFSDGRDALIIDMGGTTSDIAFIKDGQPTRAENGVQVGAWRTFVKGLFVDTFGLGGDSRVCYKDDQLYLGERRVIPLCQLADQFPEVTAQLRKISERRFGHSKPLYEHIVLMKDIEGNDKFSEQEQQLCAALKTGPLSLEAAAAVMQKDVYNADFERLEREGVVLRSGLTPTDMMCIKGDLDIYDSQASAYALAFLELSMDRDAKELANQVYDLVKEKLYCNLVRILMQDTFHGNKKMVYDESIDRLVHESFWRQKQQKAAQMFAASFRTDATLIGVGAPTHVFLPEVAQLLGTEYQIPEYAGVTNAIGALLGDVCVYDSVPIKVIYEMMDAIDVESTEDVSDPGIDAELAEDVSDPGLGDGAGYLVYGQDQPRTFAEFTDAVAYAKEQVYARAEKKALERGALEIYDTKYEVVEHRPELNYGSIFLGADVKIRLFGRIHK